MENAGDLQKDVFGSLRSGSWIPRKPSKHTGLCQVRLAKPDLRTPGNETDGGGGGMVMACAGMEPTSDKEQE